MTYKTTIQPAAEPVSLAEVKLALRLDGAELDGDLVMQIQSAREQAEHETGLLLMPQTVRLDLVDWPAELIIERAPVQSIASVSYWDGSAWQVLDADGYTLYPSGTMWRVDPVSGWPSLGQGRGPRVRVLFEAGYANAAAVPATVKRFIIAQVAAWIRTPEAFSEAKLTPSPFLSGMLDTVRIYA